MSSPLPPIASAVPYSAASLPADLGKELYHAVTSTDVSHTSSEEEIKAYVEKLESFVSRGADLETTNEGGWPLLRTAINQGIPEVVKLFLTNGANPNIKTQLGENMLQYALVMHGEEGPCKQILETFLEHAPSMTISDLSSALVDSIVHENLPCAELLLNSGAEVNFFDEHGYTALGTAIEGGREDFVRILLKAGADCSCVCRILDRDRGVERFETAKELSLRLNKPCIAALIQTHIESSAEDFDFSGRLFLKV